MRTSLRFLTTPRAFQPTFRATSLSSRSFTTQTRLSAGKEDKDRSPEEVERVKQEQLKKQEKGEGHWHEELASAGEAGVAADRQNVKDHEEHMEDLQKQTAQKAEKEHPQGKQ
ncbi:hypothetical protein MBLNU230_g3694t1 [Neophaeotheca triangularis]